jgi:hypothetical protein
VVDEETDVKIRLSIAKGAFALAKKQRKILNHFRSIYPHLRKDIESLPSESLWQQFRDWLESR